MRDQPRPLADRFADLRALPVLLQNRNANSDMRDRTDNENHANTLVGARSNETSPSSIIVRLYMCQQLGCHLVSKNDMHELIFTPQFLWHDGWQDKLTREAHKEACPLLRLETCEQHSLAQLEMHGEEPSHKSQTSSSRAKSCGFRAIKRLMECSGPSVGFIGRRHLWSSH